MKLKITYDTRITRVKMCTYLFTQGTLSVTSDCIKKSYSVFKVTNYNTVKYVIARNTFKREVCNTYDWKLDRSCNTDGT